MNDQSSNRRALSYVVEFVKFATAFSAIIAAALFALQFASAAMNG